MRSRSALSRLLETATDHLLDLRGRGTAAYRDEWYLKDVVLIAEHDGWPVGTAGVVIEPFEDAALVEISGGMGVTLDEFAVPYDDLRVVEAPASSASA